ncbi:putative acetyl-CoA carboxylase, biotin carboxyl carrier protein [Marvinbryantia formatexigens DSM 14469]|uniref:Biotin carboxyl carrier protein of acetyl-CoA carboxylase n=1 Tax=Marvinbryantia formatexigens DSM 14469 TaxID=478749 RepID=C6L8T5_9FIRM|nr:acetyl-CoA carboxylase biotin carboxyl carrier protein [Marvinbryantia formatexigens]EET62674.1 putative acetyl-CoA carboxylase, biotin carboxyl carrier protein [Marvinbryantia formatexigens DSM 14469]UWO23051.1 acetyl-CoA carboxylase biotin carboxyl carrier protein [Marvinbryantia formatexigens DSM 14469]SDF97258.1 Biotin-requiring enzyme [Marvinbryantia formatexigens]
MEFSLNEIFCVIDKVQQAGVASLSYQDADTKLHIKMQGGAEVDGDRESGRQGGAGANTCSASAGMEAGGSRESGGYGGTGADTCGAGVEAGENRAHAGSTATGGTHEEASQEGKKTGEARYIESPMVGTFYTAPSEKEAPFVSVGDTVKKGQVVAIIEAMKLMNEVEAECSGVVEEILAENEQLVEYGQPLFRLR